MVVGKHAFLVFVQIVHTLSESTSCNVDVDSAECNDKTLFVQKSLASTEFEGADSIDKSCEEITRQVDECLGVDMENSTSKMKKLIVVRTYEIASKLIAADCSLAPLGEGWDNDPQILGAAKVAAEEAAVSLVNEEFESRISATLTGKNLTDDSIEQFAKIVENLLEMCPDTEEKERLDVNDLSEALHAPPSTNLSVLVMDIATYVEGRCKEDVLDLEFFVGKFVAATGSSCNDLVTSGLLERHRQETRKLEYYAKSALALHDDTNKLGHHLVTHLRGEGPQQASFPDALMQAARNVSRRSAIARLQYVEEKHFEDIHGLSRSSYCSGYNEFARERPDHWIAQSSAIKSYVTCMCSEQRPALVCDAENRADLQVVVNKLALELLELQKQEHGLLQTSTGLSTNFSANGTEMGKSNLSGGIGLGPCEDDQGKPAPVSCSLCVDGSNCIDSNGEGVQDIFASVKPLFNQAKSCVTGSCEVCVGIKPGDPLMFKLELGASIPECGNKQEIFASFQIFIALKLCIGGVLGDIADKIGWSACVQLVKAAWHPYISKGSAEFSLPVFIPWVRATFRGNLNLGEPTPLVLNYCKNKPHYSQQLICLNEMYEARGPTGVHIKVQFLVGFPTFFFGDVGKWVDMAEKSFEENDNSRELAMNHVGVTIVKIGRSSKNEKCGKSIEALNCDTFVANKGYRVNRDHKDAGDSFRVSTDGRKVCVKRTDSTVGWDMNLEIACRVSKDTKDLNPVVAVGKSYSNQRCVFPPEGMNCKENAGNPGVRLGFDAYDDKFIVTKTASGRICAKRSDSAGGWGMNLILECDATHSSDNKWTPTTVHVGKSFSRQRCVMQSHAMHCEHFAGNQGYRVNDDSAGDKFWVQYIAPWVCAKRLDTQDDSGWYMDLTLQCKRGSYEGDVVKVYIGPSDQNQKCVDTGRKDIWCSNIAADPGYRVNLNKYYDHFSVRVSGSEVCAKRRFTNSGWGQPLEISCFTKRYR